MDKALRVAIEQARYNKYLHQVDIYHGKLKYRCDKLGEFIKSQETPSTLWNDILDPKFSPLPYPDIVTFADTDNTWTCFKLTGPMQAAEKIPKIEEIPSSSVEDPKLSEQIETSDVESESSSTKSSRSQSPAEESKDSGNSSDSGISSQSSRTPSPVNPEVEEKRKRIVEEWRRKIQEALAA